MPELIIPIKRFCQTCGGILQLRGKNKVETIIHFKDAPDETVTRYQEEWHCHNGHLNLRNVLR